MYDVDMDALLSALDTAGKVKPEVRNLKSPTYESFKNIENKTKSINENLITEITELKQVNSKLHEQFEFAKKESISAKKGAIIANIISVVSAIVAVVALFK